MNKKAYQNWDNVSKIYISFDMKVNTFSLSLFLSRLEIQCAFEQFKHIDMWNSVSCYISWLNSHNTIEYWNSNVLERRENHTFFLQKESFADEFDGMMRKREWEREWE